MSLHVLIAGGGLGGLALAHGLRGAGIEVTVLERDETPDSRPQGYRIHVDAMGHAALAECLPEDLYQLYVATSSRTPEAQQAVFFDHHFTETGVGDARVAGFDPEVAPTAVDRMTLRRILLTRLDEVVLFGREVDDVRTGEDGVVLRLSDGGSIRGDVLVAADGIQSAVRRTLLPHARVHDTGVRAVTGKTPLSDLDGGLPARLDNSFTGVHGPDFRTLAMAVYRSRRPQDLAAAELAPDAGMAPVGDYLMWLQLARVEDFPVDDRRLRELDGAGLHRLALTMLDGWHPGLLDLVRPAEKSSIFPLSIRAVLPVDAWTPTPVTLLGDAAHAMAPIGGRGANTALRDAADLTAKLSAVARGELSPLTAIGDYEQGMREHGYVAVETSLRNAGPSIGARSPYAEPVGTAD
jgi:salicylate hydroxylase